MTISSFNVFQAVTFLGLTLASTQTSLGTLMQLGCWINLEGTEVNIHSACNHHHHHHNHHHYHVAIMTSTLVQEQSPSCNPLLARGHTPPRGCSAQAGELRLGKPGQIYIIYMALQTDPASLLLHFKD